MSDRVRQGERKARVLRAAEDRGEITTTDLCRWFDISESWARDVCRTLADRDRLERTDGEIRPGAGRSAHRYTLGDRGEEYLDWWEDQHGSRPEPP